MCSQLRYAARSSTQALEISNQSSITTMRFLRSLLPSLLLTGAGVAQAASSWGFDEAILTITSAEGRGAQPSYSDKYVTRGCKLSPNRTITNCCLHRLSDHVPLSKSIPFRPTEKLKILLSATEDGKPKRPHQAFLMVRDQDTGLEISFPFTMNDNGRGPVEFVRFPYIHDT